MSRKVLTYVKCGWEFEKVTTKKCPLLLDITGDLERSNFCKWWRHTVARLVWIE